MTDPASPREPGRVLSIIAIVFAFVFPPLGLILGLVAQRQARAAGEAGDLARVAVIACAATLILTIVIGLAAATVVGFGG